MLQKRLMFCSLALMLGLGACSVDEGDDAFAKNIEADASSYSVAYKGYWQVMATGSGAVTGDLSDWSSTDKTSEPAVAEPSSLLFQPDRMLVGINPMPQQLLMSLVGAKGGKADASQGSYSMSFSEKGYSSTAVLYALTTPDYQFTYSIGMGQHSLRVEFGAASEMMVDTYSRLLTVVLNVKAVYVDNVQVAGSDILLVMQSTEGE